MTTPTILDLLGALAVLAALFLVIFLFLPRARSGDAATAPVPGYYKTDPRALTIRELLRWYGPLRMPAAYLATRKKPSAVGLWMPALWADLECSAGELSARFWEATASRRSALERLGFVQCGLGRLKPELNLNPGSRDQGRITYLDSSRSVIAGLAYHRTKMSARAGEKEQVVVWFTSVYPGSILSCTTPIRAFAGPPGETTHRFNSDDPAFIHARFLELCRRQTGPAQIFRDDAALRRWFDERQVRTFQHHVRRGLWVKMTDQEITDARRKMPPALPAGVKF